MIRIDQQQIANVLDYRALVDGLAQLFVAGCEIPPRTHHKLSVPGEEANATLLLMPAWSADGFLGVKVASVYPGNGKIGLPSVSAEYLLINAANGTPLALIEGGELTARRTAATSALAAKVLAGSEVRSLLIVGTGRLSRHLAKAHCAVRPGLHVAIWGRNPEAASVVASDLCESGIDARPANDLATAVAWADIVSCATLSTAPLIRGEWLKRGVHLDLVGSFTPHMREVDDASVAGAGVFCDTLEAMRESGDLLGPIERGVLAHDGVIELAEVLRGKRSGRTSAEQRTLFKSVGSALEDLAAAMLVYRVYSLSA